MKRIGHDGRVDMDKQWNVRLSISRMTRGRRDSVSSNGQKILDKGLKIPLALFFFFVFCLNSISQQQASFLVG